MEYIRSENKFTYRVEKAEFIGTRVDPFGFWKVEGRRGKDKIDIPGEFTSADTAKAAVERKLEELKVPKEESL